jgi:hypothetical protein
LILGLLEIENAYFKLGLEKKIEERTKKAEQIWERGI